MKELGFLDGRLLYRCTSGSIGGGQSLLLMLLWLGIRRRLPRVIDLHLLLVVC
jgi:hypothetical protein